MASEWPTVRIEDIAAKIAMGPFGSNIKVETFVETGIPIISGAHLRGVRMEDGDFNFVTEEHAERMRNSNVFRGDVIFRIFIGLRLPISGFRFLPFDVRRLMFDVRCSAPLSGRLVGGRRRPGRR